MNEFDSRKLTNLGLRATKIYVVVLFATLPTLAYFGGLELKPLELNQIGDFLAGAFGPLAIFWLVLGFFQQGKELRNSVATLKLQAKELANSVSQQKELVAVTKAALEHEKTLLGLSDRKRKAAIQPNLIFSFGTSAKYGNEQYSYSLSVTNTGEGVSNFSAVLSSAYLPDLWLKAIHLKEGDTISNKFADGHPFIKNDLFLTTNYQDRDGAEHEVQYFVEGSLLDGRPVYDFLRKAD